MVLLPGGIGSKEHDSRLGARGHGDGLSWKIHVGREELGSSCTRACSVDNTAGLHAQPREHRCPLYASDLPLSGHHWWSRCLGVVELCPLEIRRTRSDTHCYRVAAGVLVPCPSRLFGVFQ